MGKFQDAIDHLKHRLNPKTIAKEAIETFETRILPSGADEIVNALNTGSAYLPWPGQGEQLIEPMPEITAEIGPAVHVTEIGPSEPSLNFDAYMNGYADHPANRYRDEGLDR